ncbi:hypothetical protein DP43_6262 [Burkholderia pseudomallei]|nr:hypothetical protein DP43_6262 [Burkholderia pseudomallei]
MRTRNEHDYSPERGRYRSSVATRAASAGALSGRARSGRNCKRSRAGEWRPATGGAHARGVGAASGHAHVRRARLLARARTLSIVGCNTRRVGRRAERASAKRSQLQRPRAGEWRPPTHAIGVGERNAPAARSGQDRPPGSAPPAARVPGASRVTRRSSPAVRDRSARCLPSCPARCPCSAATPTRRRAHGAPRRRRSRRD